MPTTPSASAVHDERASEARAEAAGLRRRSGRLSLARGLSFFGAAVASLGILVFASDPGVVLPTLAVALLASFVALAVIHARVLRAQRHAEARESLAQKALARIARDWTELPVPRLPARASEAVVARDLDLFGTASLFQLLGTVATPPGKSTLARWLLEPAEPPEIKARQNTVRSLTPRIDARQELELAALELEKDDPNPEPFLSWAEGRPWLRARPAVLWLARGATVLSIALFVAGAAGALPWVAWLALALANLGFSALCAEPMGEVFERTSAAERSFGAYSRCFALLADAELAEPLAEQLGDRLGSGSDSAHAWMARLAQRAGLAEARRTGAVHVVLQAAVLWDFHALDLLERWQLEAGPRSRGWLDALGKAEALTALAALAHDHPDWSYPKVEENGDPILRGEGLGHPLLPPEARVDNDVQVGPPGTVLLLTGSNMSGKSTLLRAIGVNAVLAQAGGPVCARELTLPPVELGTSVLVEDSLASGISFFMAELERLSAIVRAAERCRREGGRRLLFLLDEILRGTNAAERRVAVTRVLRHLIDRHAIGAISTHDLELADVPDLVDSLDSHHFRETIDRSREPPMTFDYQLRDGVATTTNAIELLELVGLGDEAG